MNPNAVDGLSEERAKEILKALFTAYATPAFGALPRREADLVVFRAMREAGAVAAAASLYALMTGLRITKAKARNLLFDIEVRGDMAPGALDGAAKAAIAHPKGFVVDGSYIAIGIESPLVQAHLRERVRALGHLTDASFDASVVKLKPGALAALVESLMTEAERKNFERAMQAAGLKGRTSLREAIAAGLLHLARKAVGERAAEIGASFIEDVADEVADFVQPTVEDAVERVRAILEYLFPADGGGGQGAAGPRVRAT